MKKLCILMAFVLVLGSVCVSCSKAEVKEPSIAGAYYLMFKEFSENRVELTKYRYLSFDKESTGLEGEELELLEGMIKDYCKEMKLDYLDLSMQDLMKASRIKFDNEGKVFTSGHLLTFDKCEMTKDDDGNTYFTGSIHFWHADFEGMGGLDFNIIQTSDGWYINRSLENGGYDVMVS